MYFFHFPISSFPTSELTPTTQSSHIVGSHLKCINFEPERSAECGVMHSLGFPAHLLHVRAHFRHSDVSHCESITLLAGFASRVMTSPTPRDEKDKRLLLNQLTFRFVFAIAPTTTVSATRSAKSPWENAAITLLLTTCSSWRPWGSGILFSWPVGSSIPQQP